MDTTKLKTILENHYLQLDTIVMSSNITIQERISKIRKLKHNIDKLHSMLGM